jgi:hypothetical protein
MGISELIQLFINGGVALVLTAVMLYLHTTVLKDISKNQELTAKLLSLLEDNIKDMQKTMIDIQKNQEDYDKRGIRW